MLIGAAGNRRGGEGQLDVWPRLEIEHRLNYVSQLWGKSGPRCWRDRPSCATFQARIAVTRFARRSGKKVQ